MSDRDVIMEAREMAIKAEGAANLALSRIDAHEEVCAERYGEITKGIRSLWGLILTVAGVLVSGMAGIIILLVQNGGHL